VTLVLRLIRQSRWDTPKTCDWLAPGDIPADPLADFANTCENCLSVWFLDDDKKDLDDLIAALAANREKADRLDYVLFAEENLKEAEIVVASISGQTPDEQVNGLHRDLTQLSAAKVLALTKIVWHKNLGLHRVDAKRGVQLVAAAVLRGRISLDKLRPKLRDDVRICLAEQPNGPRRTK
jgi:hypothetical protein